MHIELCGIIQWCMPWLVRVLMVGVLVQLSQQVATVLTMKDGLQEAELQHETLSCLCRPEKGACNVQTAHPAVHCSGEIPALPHSVLTDTSLVLICVWYEFWILAISQKTFMSTLPCRLRPMKLASVLLQLNVKCLQCFWAVLLMSWPSYAHLPVHCAFTTPY